MQEFPRGPVIRAGVERLHEVVVLAVLAGQNGDGRDIADDVLVAAVDIAEAVVPYGCICAT